MNTAMSITWSTVGIHGDQQVLGSQKRFLERLRKWFDHRGIWPAWIWALERGRKRGLHSHLLISVPGELAKDFRVGVRAILEGVVKRPLVETKNEKTVDFAVRQGVQIVAQWEDFRYIMKGLEPGSFGWRAEDDLDELHLEDRARIRTRPQGIVTLKRLGMSRELDSASYGRWAAVNDFPAAKITDDPTQQLYDDRFWQWFVVNEDQLIEPPRNKKRKLSKEETEADG
jgi:hypothetical protein